MKELPIATLPCRGTTLAYRRRTGRGPTIILVHGISDDSGCWPCLLRRLDRDADLVLPELRGHGRSEAPEDGWTLTDMAEELAALIEGLGLRSPILVGHSLGAALSLTLAARHPGLPKAVFLEDPTPVWVPEDGRMGERRAKIAAWLEAEKRKTRADFITELAAQPIPWKKEEWEPWIEAKYRMSPRAVRIVQAGALMPADFGAELARIVCPVLLLGAETAREAICDEGDFAALRRLVPHAELRRASRAGHNIRREAAEAYFEALLPFLAGH